MQKNKNHSDLSPDGQNKPIKDTGSKDIKREREKKTGDEMSGANQLKMRNTMRGWRDQHATERLVRAHPSEQSGCERERWEARRVWLRPDTLLIVLPATGGRPSQR